MTAPGFHPCLALSRRRNSRGPPAMARARAPARQNEAEGPGGSEAYRAERQEARKGRLAGRQAARTSPREVGGEGGTRGEGDGRQADRQAAGDGTAARGRSKENGAQRADHKQRERQRAGCHDDLAVRVWQHAAKLEPGAPWKCLRAHGVLDALSLDAYRVTRLPPGLRPDRSRSFLATPAG